MKYTRELSIIVAGALIMAGILYQPVVERRLAVTKNLDCLVVQKLESQGGMSDEGWEEFKQVAESNGIPIPVTANFLLRYKDIVNVICQ